METINIIITTLVGVFLLILATILILAAFISWYDKSILEPTNKTECGIIYKYYKNMACITAVKYFDSVKDARLFITAKEAKLLVQDDKETIERIWNKMQGGK